MIGLADTEKVLDEIQYSFMVLKKKKMLLAN